MCREKNENFIFSSSLALVSFFFFFHTFCWDPAREVVRVAIPKMLVALESVFSFNLENFHNFS